MYFYGASLFIFTTSSRSPIELAGTYTGVAWFTYDVEVAWT
jgi:hypothetical protein